VSVPHAVDQQLLLAVDGGNSKTDVLLIDVSGRVLAHVRGPSCAPIHLGLEGAMDSLDLLVRRVLADAASGVAGEPTRPAVGVFAQAGADLPDEEEQLLAACRRRGWVDRAVVRNDAFALLSAGTDRGWGIAVVCGAGINGVGVSPDGAVVRFPAFGAISGDWGGGYDVGLAALAAAARAQDGRGRPTVLASAVPAYFGLADPLAVSIALHRGELSMSRLVELPPCCSTPPGTATAWRKRWSYGSLSRWQPSRARRSAGSPWCRLTRTWCWAAACCAPACLCSTRPCGQASIARLLRPGC
jgi:N-acetylglucosamine kinase-like BadF-type ATPase